MFIEIALTPEEVQRTDPASASAETLTKSYVRAVNAWDVLAIDIFPVFRNARLDARQQCFIGLFSRSLGFARSVQLMGSWVHFQSVTSAERSLLEICTDMLLLHRNLISEGVEKFSAFVDIQRLKTARRIVEFYRNKPHLDPDPDNTCRQKEFVDQNEARINALRFAIFRGQASQKSRLDHWSQLDMLTRAALLGERMESLVLEGYDMRNSAVHTGLAAVHGLDQTSFDQQTAHSFGNIWEFLLRQMEVLGAEMKLPTLLPEFDTMLEDLRDFPRLALADEQLRESGAPSRLRVKAGRAG